MRHFIAVFAVAACTTAAPAPLSSRSPKPPVPRLTEAEVAAAGDAVRAALPPVDQGLVATCKRVVDVANGQTSNGPTLLDAASCMRSAGALGAAIEIWRTLATDPDRSLAVAARRELGRAYEAAGMFAEAAEAHLAYVRFAPGAPDAEAQRTRGVCLAWQVGTGDVEPAAPCRLLVR